MAGSCGQEVAVHSGGWKFSQRCGSPGDSQVLGRPSGEGWRCVLMGGSWSGRRRAPCGQAEVGLGQGQGWGPSAGSPGQPELRGLRAGQGGWSVWH